MRKYSLAQAMKVRHIHNEDYFCNSHFLLNKSILNNTELKRIESVDMTQDGLNDMMDRAIRPRENGLQYYRSREIFTPTDVIVGDITDRGQHKILYDGSTGIALNEFYYNFIVKAKKCTLHVGENNLDLLTAINNKGELVGILLPVRLGKTDTDMKYAEYMEELERIRLEKKKARDSK